MCCVCESLVVFEMAKILSQNANKILWRTSRIVFYERLYFNNKNCVRKSLCSHNSTLNLNENRLKPVQLAFDSYQFTKTTSSLLPVVIVHGLFGSKSNWKSLSKEIARVTKRKVYAVDIRNHGESPHSTDFNYQYMAEDLICFLREMNIKKSLLVGHSMGGRITMLVALNKPELVEKLIAVDVSPFNIPDNFNNTIFQYLKVMQLSIKQLPSGISLSKARQFIDKCLSTVAPNIEIRQFLLTNLVEINKEVKWRCNLDVISENFITGVSNFPLPIAEYNEDTLFICGEKSPYVLKSDHDKIRNVFPKARFTYVMEAGHWVHSEKPIEFLRILTEFVQNCTN